MEENKFASISINLNDGSLTISGPEAFFEKHLSEVFDFVERNRKMVPFEDNPPDNSSAAEDDKFDASSNSSEKGTKKNDKELDDKYVKAGVYHIDSEDSTISILKKVPGGSKAEKTKNIALIVLYIRKSKIEARELIPICEKHACYDSNNFSATFKNEMTNFVRKGTGQSWTIELTQPGEEAAIALLEEMANDKK